MANPDWLGAPVLVEGDHVVAPVLAVPEEELRQMRALYHLLGPTLPLLSREQVERALGSPGVTVLASRRGGELAGLVTLVAAQTPVRTRAWAEDLVVSPKHRRSGVATALMRACASMAAEAGASELTGTVHPRRRDAIVLYEGLGWNVGPSLAARLQVPTTE